HHSVAQFHHLFCSGNLFVFAVHEKGPETFQETVHSVDSSVVPLSIQLWRSYEKLIHSQGVTSVITHKVIRRNNISLGFTHLDSVLSCDHTLVEQLLERLVKIDHADITQEFRIESGVQKMKHRVLHASDIHIHRKHLVRLLTGY